MHRLPRIEIHAADHCVLKCRHCSHAADIAPKRLYRAAEYQPWFELLSRSGVKFGQIELLGGEPFMNRHLAEYVDLGHRYSDRVGAMSNLFWLKDEKSIERHATVLSKLNFLIVTLYTPLVEKCGGLENVQRLVAVMEKRFPNLKISHFTPKLKPIKRFGEIEFSKDAMPIIQRKCAFRGCKQLMHDGTVIGCAPARRVINWPEVDRFDLKLKPFNPSKFVSWFNKPVLDLCKHCSIATKGTTMVPWSEVGHR